MPSTINADNGVVSGSSGVKTTADTSGVLALQSNGSTGLTLDTSLNVGVGGVTPSAWATFKAVELTGGAIAGIGTNQFDVVQNAFYDTSFKYKTTGAATFYQQAGATHAWYTAASGTAGNAITFTQAMTLDASGDLGVGTTNPSSYASKTLQVNGSSTDVTIKLTNTTTGEGNASGFDFELNGNDINYVNRTASGVQKFWTNSTERFRIASAGQLGIGGANYGSSGQVLTSGGSGTAPSWATPSGGLTLGTPVATTSGTTIDFTGIPAGTKQIVITFVGVSTSGSSVKIIQLGDSGGIETSGYSDNSVLLRNNSAVLIDSRAAGYSIHSDAAGDLLRGSVTLTLQDSSTNTWVADGSLFLTGSRACILAGSKALTGTLTSVRITADNGLDNFDAGSINIAYM